MAVYNRTRAAHYRAGDDLQVHTDHHRHICEKLSSITASFKREISVLDIGCGSGRYFHCIRNARRLLGIDISPHMLEQAKNPVFKDQIRIESIELRCADIFDARLEPRSFDVAYSIGVLGEYSPLNAAVCSVVYDALTEDGVFFFTVVDRRSKDSRKGLKRRIAEAAYVFAPAFMRKILDKKLRTFYLTREELVAIMDASPFRSSNHIDRYVHNSPYWQGAHFECTAFKRGGKLQD